MAITVEKFWWEEWCSKSWATERFGCNSWCCLREKCHIEEGTWMRWQLQRYDQEVKGPRVMAGMRIKGKILA